MQTTPENTSSTIFREVWYRPKTRPWSLIAYRDIGTLTITDDQIDFSGRYDHIVLDSIDDLAFGTVGIDFMNNWVQVKCGDLDVCFADGGWLGWRDKFKKSTRKILRAIIDRFPEEEELIQRKQESEQGGDGDTEDAVFKLGASHRRRHSANLRQENEEKLSPDCRRVRLPRFPSTRLHGQ